MLVQKLLLPLLLPLLIVLPSCSYSSAEEEATSNNCECLLDRAEEYRILEQKYVWGDWDCSKFIYQILTDCGIAVLRCRSINYSNGECGLDTSIIPLNMRTCCDFAFWTFPGSKEPFGHTGIFKDKITVYHNSTGRKKVVLDPISWKTYLRDHLKKVRRLEE